MLLPRFESDWITARLKAGRNPLTADEARSLVDEGITHVLDLREPREWAPPRLGQEALDEIAARGLVRAHLPIEDGGPPALDTLNAAVAFIDEALEDPRARVYVHCRAGIERTACVLVAWWARRFRVGYDTALAALEGKRPGLWPTAAQEEVTRAWIDAASGREAT